MHVNPLEGILVSMYKIAIVNEKGGVGKTTSAVSLATLLNARGSCVLVDADPNHSALDWVQAGAGMGFDAFSLEAFDQLEQFEYTFMVLDTKAGEAVKDLVVLAQSFDLLIIPSKPDPLSLRVLIQTLQPLQEAHATNFKVLLTDVPPAPSTDGHEARMALQDSGIPMFAQSIRRAAAFSKAALNGTAVNEVKGDSRAKLAHMDYDLVVREILA